ncbi:Cation channel sperm-associated protein subunit delta [Camelus dromedarius]|uniref:Cation channel sperm-associated auxiliary subunit delta n=1 Tax=Camelus dromedarius TaxID=9838 RepID=A0A5N4CKR1_CAMDR|nr:Cation channel sperm-associated protein subunit delta [Camelus dromedarius]
MVFARSTAFCIDVRKGARIDIVPSVAYVVVNQEVYIYDYEANSWNASKANTREKIIILRSTDDTATWMSATGRSIAELVGSLGGIFYFHSLSQVGLLLVNQQKAMFSYSDYPLNLNFGLPFDYNGTLDILIAPGQKGILIFWCEKSLLVSQNAGQLVNPVQVREGQHVLYSSISEANISVHSVAANENELAVLTQESYLYYGSLGILPSSLIKFAGQNIRSEEAVLVFTDVGMLEILSPLPDPLFPAFDFQKCPVNIQATLMDPQLQVDVCKMELLQGEFDNKMYTIDMNSKLELRALMIPRTGTSPVSLVMASNPHSLGLQALIYEDGYTLNGNTKHRLTALISVGCDLEKKIIIQNEISACYNGLLDLVTLQDNYSYVIEKDTYDPNFQGQKATEDLVVHYQYEKLGCPVLVFYDTPWKPVVEL